MKIDGAIITYPSKDEIFITSHSLMEKKQGPRPSMLIFKDATIFSISCPLCQNNFKRSNTMLSNVDNVALYTWSYDGHLE